VRGCGPAKARLVAVQPRRVVAGVDEDGGVLGKTTPSKLPRGGEAPMAGKRTWECQPHGRRRGSTTA